MIHEAHLDFADELDDHAMVENIRITGTILAFDVKTDHHEYFYTNPIKEVLGNFYLEQGILLRPLGNVVYILPPYCISKESLHKVYQVIRESLDQLNKLSAS